MVAQFSTGILAHFSISIYIYTDLTNPYAGYVLNLQKLKAYNQFMFPLAMALNREL